MGVHVPDIAQRFFQTQNKEPARDPDSAYTASGSLAGLVSMSPCNVCCATRAGHRRT